MNEIFQYFADVLLVAMGDALILLLDKFLNIKLGHRLRIHRCATRGISCLTYTSYPLAFLASTHARFYKELDGETSNKRRF